MGVVRAPPEPDLAVGYNVNHGRYEHQKAAAAALAYRKPQELIHVLAHLTYSLPGRTKNKLVENIRLGLAGIPARIGAIKLKQRIYNKIIPKFHEYAPAFPLAISDLQFLTLDNWEDLDAANPHTDAVYHYFLHPGKKPGEVIFKPWNLKVELVITARNWDKIQEHLANQEPMGRSSLGPGGNPGLFLDPPADILESDTWSPPPLCQILHNVGKPPSSHQLASVFPSVMQSAGLPSRTSILSDQVPVAVKLSTHWRKKSNSPEWQSPDRAVLRSVLQQQVANAKLPTLGMIPYESIAVKRAYYKETIRGKDRVKRFSGAYEVDIMGREGKALYWAMSLMDMVYCFVKCHVGKAAVSQEGFAVPEEGAGVTFLIHVRFVNAGLAIIRNTEGKATKALLLEQLIDACQDLFRTFVHTGSAKPYRIAGAKITTWHASCVLRSTCN
ncbi:hypothetical protein JB92DRAFT_2838998 [Gautieria morchelliformis]|nr:hypothetical protein JB92DRAFT_2838998 [Gautieria morchelliformis]